MVSPTAREEQSFQFWMGDKAFEVILIVVSPLPTVKVLSERAPEPEVIAIALVP